MKPNWNQVMSCTFQQDRSLLGRTWTRPPFQVSRFADESHLGDLETICARIGSMRLNRQDQICARLAKILKARKKEMKENAENVPGSHRISKHGKNSSDLSFFSWHHGGYETWCQRNFRRCGKQSNIVAQYCLASFGFTVSISDSR